MIGEISELKREVNLQFEQQRPLVDYVCTFASLDDLAFSSMRELQYFLWIAFQFVFALSVRSYLGGSFWRIFWVSIAIFVYCVIF